MAKLAASRVRARPQMPGRLCFSCGFFSLFAATTTLSFTAALDRRGKRGGRKDIDPYNVQQKMMAKSETRFPGSSSTEDPSTVDAAEEVDVEGEGQDDYNFFEEDDNTTHREAEQVQEEVGSKNNKNKPAGRSEPPDEQDSKAGLIFVALVCVIAAYSWVTGSSASSSSSSSSPAAGRSGTDLDAEAIRAQRLKKFAALESPRQEPRVELLCKKNEEVDEKENKSEDATISSGRQATLGASTSTTSTSPTARATSTSTAKATSANDGGGNGQDKEAAAAATTALPGAEVQPPKAACSSSTKAAVVAQKPELTPALDKKLGVNPRSPVAIKPNSTTPVSSTTVVVGAEKKAVSPPADDNPPQETRPAAASPPATALSPESNDAPHPTPKPLRVFITCNSQLSKAVAALSPLPFTEEPFVFEDRKTATVGDLKTALFQRVVPGEISPEEEKNILSLAGLPPEEGQAGGASVAEYTSKKLCLLFRGRILNQDEKLLAESGFGKFGEDRVMFLYR